MDVQIALTGILVACCAALALRRCVGADARARLAALAARLPLGALIARWLVLPRAGGACGGCCGCAGPGLAAQQASLAALPRSRVIPLRVVVASSGTLQRPCGAASHWRASSTQ
jgi:hypothetical protein